MAPIQYPDDLGSKFRFIVAASLRCRQLQKGAKPRLQSRSKKYTIIAQEEVLAGKILSTDGPQPTAADLAHELLSPGGGDVVE